jgi:hypothetical protein
MHGGSLEELLASSAQSQFLNFTAPSSRFLRDAPAARRTPPTGLIYQFCPMVMPQPSAVNGPRTMDLLYANWVLMDAEAAHGERYLRPPGRAVDAPLKAPSGDSGQPDPCGSPHNLSSTAPLRLEKRKQPR